MDGTQGEQALTLAVNDRKGCCRRLPLDVAVVRRRRSNRTSSPLADGRRILACSRGGKAWAGRKATLIIADRLLLILIYYLKFYLLDIDGISMVDARGWAGGACNRCIQTPPLGADRNTKLQLFVIVPSGIRQKGAHGQSNRYAMEKLHLRIPIS